MTTRRRTFLGLPHVARFIDSLTVFCFELIFFGLIFFGLIFVAAPSAEAQTLTTLYTFTGGANGALAFGGVVADPSGNLYGITGYGGDTTCNSNFNPPGCGTVYKVDSAGNETILHAFSGPPDGQVPASQLLLSGGNLYGTTSQGGVEDHGTVFELLRTGHELADYSFMGGTDASSPYAGVTPVANDDVVGAGYFGGTNGEGAIFKIKWNCAAGVCPDVLLHSFAGGASDGAYPDIAPVPQSEALFGTTVYGGSGTCNNGFASGCGTAYKLTESAETLLHTFSGPDGSYPTTLISDKKGGFYGVTTAGGSSGNGTVFQMSASGAVTTLYSFAGGSDGTSPAGLIQDSMGNLLGTTNIGGTYDAGTIFELSPDGPSGWTEKVLYTFTGGADGYGPQTGIALDEMTHTLYGSTSEGGDLNCYASSGCGTVFALSY
jgi:uncharacterized repeat protein (TIGR03803 family)